MQQVDFQGLSTELKRLVAETRLRIEGVDFKGLADQWKKTGESVDALARSPDALRALENLNKTLDALRARDRAGWTRRSTRTGRTCRRRSSRPRRPSSPSTRPPSRPGASSTPSRTSGADTTRALEKVADAAESIQRLADFLERNPNAIVSGRKQPAVRPARP